MIIHYGYQYSILVQNPHHIKGVLVDLEEAQSDLPFTEKAFVISQEGTTTIFSDIVRPEPYELRRDYKKYNHH